MTDTSGNDIMTIRLAQIEKDAGIGKTSTVMSITHKMPTANDMGGNFVEWGTGAVTIVDDDVVRELAVGRDAIVCGHVRSLRPDATAWSRILSMKE